MAGSDHVLSSKINVILNTNKGKQNATQAFFIYLQVKSKGCYNN